MLGPSWETGLLVVENDPVRIFYRKPRSPDCADQRLWGPAADRGNRADAGWAIQSCLAVAW